MATAQWLNLQSAEGSKTIGSYLDQLAELLHDLPEDDRNHLLSYAKAQIELNLELEPGSSDPDEAVRIMFARLGSPADYAKRLRATALPEREQTEEEQKEEEAPRPVLTACRACRKDVSLEAYMCPHCGAPFPARKLGPASGYEWKSKARIFGIPLVHVAFGRDKNGKLRVAKGFIAIGQFGIGAITIAQFGVGAIFGLGQFTVAPIAVGQFAFGLAALGQFGIGLLYGAGQFATGLLGNAGMITWPPHP